MRKVIVFTLLTAVSGVASVRAGLSRLEALSMIETADNDAAVGGAGEISRYQIKPWIWHRYSESEAYRNRTISAEVAERHLSELEKTFEKRAGRSPSDFDVYVLWNAGPTYYGRVGFSKSRVHPLIRERAQRYANLRQRSDLRPAIAQAVPKDRGANPAATPSQKPIEARKPAVAGINVEPFWIVSPSVEVGGLQSPLFPNIPLTTQPTPSPLLDKTLLAVGGMTAKGQ